MNKTKTLSILVGILVLLNIALLVFFLIGRPKGPKRDGHRGGGKSEQFIKKNFDFDDAQMALFDESKERHFKKMKDLHPKLKSISRVFYLVDRNKNSQKSDSLLNEVNTLNQEIYLLNLKHFEEVRAICKPDQVDGMEEFINVLMKKRNRKGKRGRR